MKRFPGLIGVTAAVLVLSAACGGKDPSPPATQSGGAATLGTAEGRATAAPAAAATTRPGTVGSPAAAAPSPAGAPPAGATRPSPAPSPAGAGGVAASGGAAAGVVATPHPDTPNPCTLVTQAEAEAALGGRPFPGRERRSRDSAEVRCTYDYLNGGRVAVVAVWKGSEARSVYELRRSAYGQGATVEDVRGLGDRAFVVKGDEGWVNILKGDVYVSVQIDNQTAAAEQSLRGEELRGRAMSLARAAVGRL